jgi:hypothetical protein
MKLYAAARHGTCGFERMITDPRGGMHVAMLFYILSGWLLFNFAFAVGMYFRPKRKRPADLIEGRTSEDAAEIWLKPPESSEQGLRGPNAEPEVVMPRETRRSLQLTRILFFGFWLRGRRRSASGALNVSLFAEPAGKLNSDPTVESP